MPHIANSVPRGCPNCNGANFSLFNLTVTCLKCGWCRKLIPKSDGKK